MNEGQIKREIKATERALAEAKIAYKTAETALRDAQAVTTAAEAKRRVADTQGGRLLSGPVLAGRELDVIGKVSISAAAYAEHDDAVGRAEHELLAIRRAHSDAFQRQRHLTRLLQHLRHTALPEAQRPQRQPTEPPQSAGGGITAY